MRVGVAIEETQAFWRAVDGELRNRHVVAQFQRRAWRAPRWLPLSEQRLNGYRLSRDLQIFMSKNQVVFFEWAGDLLLAASRQPKTCGIVTRLHRYEMYQPRLAEVRWEAVDRVILVSQAKRQEFLAHFPQMEAKTVVIPESVSLERFSFFPRQFQGDIGILCTLLPRKRVYELILAFYDLQRQQPGFHLHIGGGAHVLHKDYESALHHLVKQLGLEGQVTFYGTVADPAGWFRKIDIFISNSYSEGLQVSPMEAAASGVYCLAHRWLGADELFPPDFLFTTPNEMIEKIQSYSQLSEECQRQQLERLHAHVAANFDENQVKIRICQLVEEVGAQYA